MIRAIYDLYNYKVRNYNEKQQRTVKLGNLLAILSIILSTGYSIFYLFALDSVKAAVVNECFALSYLLYFFFLSKNKINSALLALSIVYLCQMFCIVVFFTSSRSGFQFYYLIAGPSLYYFFRNETAKYKISLTIVAFILFGLCEIIGDRYSELVLTQKQFDVLYFSTISIVFFLIIFIIHTFQKEIDSREKKLEDVAVNLSKTNDELGREIKERIEVQNAIAKSELKFRTIFNQVAVGVSLTQTNTGELLKVNKKYCEITGYSKEALSNTSFQKITHPDDLKLDLQNLNKMKAGEFDSYSMEKRYIRPDGSVVWVQLTVSPMWKFNEKRTQHIGIIEDITKRKLLEEEVKTLQGIIPICSSCKKIRDDKGIWNQIESYIREHSDAEFSHGICPECANQLYPGFIRK